MVGLSQRSMGWSRARRSAWLAGLAAAMGATGCDLNVASLFNPAFVDVMVGAEDDGGNEPSYVGNATGHVPVIFVNNLRFDSQLTTYMEALQEARRLSGVPEDVTDLRSLRPRVRIPLRVTYANGNFLTFEFIDGDGAVELDVFSDDEEDEEDVLEEVPLDARLTERDLNRLVATCDVARVEIDGNAQVFVPVYVRTIDVEIPEFGGRFRVVEQIDPPQFRPVLADEIDADFNVTLLRNFSIEDGPAPAENLRCGAVMGIVLTGTVGVPFTGPETTASDEFIASQDEVPGFLNTDTAAEASIPGRYQYLVQIR